MFANNAKTCSYLFFGRENKNIFYTYFTYFIKHIIILLYFIMLYTNNNEHNFV